MGRVFTVSWPLPEYKRQRVLCPRCKASGREVHAVFEVEKISDDKYLHPENLPIECPECGNWTGIAELDGEEIVADWTLGGKSRTPVTFTPCIRVVDGKYVLSTPETVEQLKEHPCIRPWARYKNVFLTKSGRMFVVHKGEVRERTAEEILTRLKHKRVRSSPILFWMHCYAALKLAEEEAKVEEWFRRGRQ